LGSALRIYNTVRRKAELYVSQALPFGAAAAVPAFIVHARANRELGTRLIGLTMDAVCADDLPQLDLRSKGEASQLAAERFFSLMGWKVSMKGKKHLPFSTQFEVLGVQLDLAA
jgi:hypothetical protein